MQVGQQQRAFAVGAEQVDHGAECGECNAHVRRVSGDAGGGCAEDGVVSVETIDGVAALAGRALVTAGAIIIVEIGAAGALEDVAADGGHVADLRRGAGEDGAGENGIAGAHGVVLGEGGVARGGGDAQGPVGALFDG